MPRRRFALGAERLQRAIDAHDNQYAYFLYNTTCTYRLANSEIVNMLRFTFDGTLLTDRSDCKAEQADLGDRADRRDVWRRATGSLGLAQRRGEADGAGRI